MNQKNQTHKFWNFYQPDNAPPELSIYGEIASELGWWDSVDSKVTHKNFTKELESLGDVSEIVVRINSGGGDVYAANTIYTRLRDHKAKITVKIDGIAASAATVIAMAGDVIQIPENAYMMIHDPVVGICRYVNKEDCLKMVNIMETIKKGIVSTYQGRTGKTEEEISEIMSAETWYTGKEAVESGFCDQLMFTQEESETTTQEHNVQNRLFSMGFDFKMYKNCPVELKQMYNPVSDTVKIQDFTDTTHKQSKEVKEMEIKNLEELKTAYPEFTAQIAEDAKMAERNRIQEIETVALSGYDTIVNDAKFTTGAQASEVAMQMVADQKKQGGQYLKEREADVKDSNLTEISASAPLVSENKHGGNNEAMDMVNKVFDDMSGKS